MKLKLTANVCYLAGLYGKNRSEKRNAVGIDTSMKEIEQRFVEIALKDLGIGPEKILIEDREHHRRVSFFHSQVAKQLGRIVERESIIFKRKNDLAAGYVAGLFDAAGHVSAQGVTINGLTAGDQLMLDNLGVHTNNGRVMNIRALLALIGGRSVLARKLEGSL